MSIDFTNLPPIEAPKQIDPDQLQKELQRAFNAVSERITRLEKHLIVHHSIHMLTLRALIDLDLIEIGEMISAFEKTKDTLGGEIERKVLSDMIDGIKASHSGINPSGLH